MQEDARNSEIELKLLLEAIYLKYEYDFRDYSMASMERRVRRAMEKAGIDEISELQHRLMRDPEFFGGVLGVLTVPTTEMFRDPSYFRAVREKVVPMLKTYPSIKIWIPGCSTGEEVYSMAILLREEGLTDRVMIYATDINPRSLEKARRGVFCRDDVKKFTRNYHASGGRQEFSSYYTADSESAVFDAALRKSVVFADHSLATDAVFSEMQFISCRNVLIYFNRKLQDRVFGLFSESLCYGGILGLGAKETVTFSSRAGDFRPFVAEEKLFQKRVA